MAQGESPSPGPLVMTDEIPAETAAVAVGTPPPKEAHLRRHVFLHERAAAAGGGGAELASQVAAGRVRRSRRRARRSRTEQAETLEAHAAVIASLERGSGPQ